MGRKVRGLSPSPSLSDNKPKYIIFLLATRRGLSIQKTVLMIKMSKNEDDILLEAEDKVATLKTIIGNWYIAADNTDKIGTRQRPYCLGRANGLEVCLPLIEQLEDKISKLTLEQIDLLLKDVD